MSSPDATRGGLEDPSGRDDAESLQPPAHNEEESSSNEGVDSLKERKRWILQVTSPEHDEQIATNQGDHRHAVVREEHPKDPPGRDPVGTSIVAATIATFADDRINQRRRNPQQFRTNQPGAFPIRGEREEGDGTIVIGSGEDGTSIVDAAQHLPSPQMEPLTATVVYNEEEEEANEEIGRLSASKKQHRTRNITAVSLLLLVVLLALGLGLALPRLLQETSSSQDDPPTTATPSKATILTKWEPLNGTLLSSRDDQNQFGYAVAISGDGTTLAVGAPYADWPFVDVYKLSYSQQPDEESAQTQFVVSERNRIEAPSSSSEFGWGISLSHNGLILAVGSGVNGTRLYRFNNKEWEEAEAPTFGIGSVTSLSRDGSTVAVGQSHTVQVYRTTDNWREAWFPLGTPLTGDNFEDLFGQSFALSGNGNRLVLGIPGSDARGESTGSLQILDWNGTDWIRPTGDINGIAEFDVFGTAVSMSDDGSCVAGGAVQNMETGSTVNFTGSVRSGYVHAYSWQDGDWLRRGQTLAGQSGGSFGASVDLSFDGRTMVVGAPTGLDYSGQVFIFRLDELSDQWIQTARFDGELYAVGQCGFSVSMSANGDIVAVGCPLLQVGDATQAGGVRIYREVPCDEEDLAPDNLTPCRSS